MTTAIVGLLCYSVPILVFFGVALFLCDLDDIPKGMAAIGCVSHVVIMTTLIVMLVFLSGCNLTAHVAARPVVDGTPVMIGAEWRAER